MSDEPRQPIGENEQTQPVNVKQESPNGETVQEPAKKEVQKKSTKTNLPGSLWLSKTGRVKVTVFVYQTKEGRTDIMLNAIDQEQQATMDMTEFQVSAEFSLPSRKQIDQYRRKSGRWVENALSLVTDRNQMRNHFLKYHLLSLDLPDPETGESFEIKRTRDGTLDTKSEDYLNTLHPTLLELLLTKFEREGDIVY